MTPDPQAAPVRGPGRPRAPHVEAAIVQATLELIDQVGYGRLSLEAVAVRAGVGKASIYRRWPGKAQLVVHAVATVTETHTPERPSETLRQDLIAAVERMLRKHGTTMAGRLMTRLVGESPELIACYREQVIEPRRARLLSRLQRGVDEGELRPGLQLEVMVDALVGPVMYGVLVGGVPPGQGGAYVGAYVEELVDLVLRGALAQSRREFDLRPRRTAYTEMSPR
jgi:AcrR family transcriptional regulator